MSRGVLRIELWRLLCIFLAEKPLAQLVKDTDPKGFLLYLKAQHDDDEVARLLLTTAASLRLARAHGGWAFPDDMSCGDLWRDAESDVAEPLTLWEACNKIIHADTLRHHVDRLGPVDTYWEPRVSLYGRSGQKAWKAVLDIHRYVHAGARAQPE